MYIYRNDCSYLIFAPKFGSRIIRDLHPGYENLVKSFSYDDDIGNRKEIFNQILTDVKLPIFITYRNVFSWYRSAVAEAIFDILSHHDIFKVCINACKISYNEEDISFAGYTNDHSRLKVAIKHLPLEEQRKLFTYVIHNFEHSIANNAHVYENHYLRILDFLTFAQINYPSALERVHIYSADEDHRQDIINLGVKVKLIEKKYIDLSKHHHSKSYLKSILDPILLKTVYRDISSNSSAFPFSFSPFYITALHCNSLIKNYFSGCMVDIDRYNKIFNPVK